MENTYKVLAHIKPNPVSVTGRGLMLMISLSENNIPATAKALSVLDGKIIIYEGSKYRINHVEAHQIMENSISDRVALNITGV